MGLWPSRASKSVASVTASLDNPEVFPSAAVYHMTTTGMPVPVSGMWDHPVSRELAMTVPGVQRGVTLLGTTYAGLPIERVDAEGNRVDLGWIDQPEAGRPRFSTFLDIGYDLIFDGVAYLRVHDRHSTGAPKRGGCEYISLDRLQDVQNSDGSRTILIDQRPVNPRDLIGFEGWDNGIRKHGARTIRTALALEAASRRYADTPLPSVTLVNTSGYDLSDTEIDDLIRGYKSSRNQEGVGYVNAGIEPKVVGFDAQQLQLVEARQFVNTQIANILGLPAWAIAGAASASGGNIQYANISQDTRGLIDFGLKRLLNAVEARLSMSDVSGEAWTTQVTPRGTTVRFNLDGMLRGNALERAQVYQILVPLGVLTVDEARDIEDLAPQGGTP